MRPCSDNSNKFSVLPAFYFSNSHKNKKKEERNNDE